MRTLLITNPKAGRVRKLGPPRLVSLLEDQGMDVRLIAAETPAESLDLLQRALTEQSWQRVVVAGGDGTLHSVLPVFTDLARQELSTAPLAVLPVGSVNVLARELRIPLDIPSAARVAAQGRLRRIDLGLLNDRPFVLMAGLGFDGAAVASIRTAVKARLGALEYIGSGLRLLLRHPAFTLDIECDGVRTRAYSWQVLVTNSMNYTYGWTFAPHASIDDGRLDVCIMPDLGRCARLRQVLAVLRGRPAAAGVTHLSGREIVMTADEPLPLQMDGDPAPAVSIARFEILPQALTVVVPPA